MQPDEDILYDGRDSAKRVRKAWDTVLSMKSRRRKRSDIPDIGIRFWLMLHNRIREINDNDKSVR